jgi:hypothetical protein
MHWKFIWNKSIQLIQIYETVLLRTASKKHVGDGLISAYSKVLVTNTYLFLKKDNGDVFKDLSAIAQQVGGGDRLLGHLMGQASQITACKTLKRVSKFRIIAYYVYGPCLLRSLFAKVLVC